MKMLNMIKRKRNNTGENAGKQNKDSIVYIYKCRRVGVLLFTTNQQTTKNTHSSVINSQ
jgi:hypothetical protein